MVFPLHRRDSDKSDRSSISRLRLNGNNSGGRGKKVLVYDLDDSRTTKMPRSQLDTRCREAPESIHQIPISAYNKSVAVELSDPLNMRPKEWYASVHLSPSVRIQRLFGRFDTLYITAGWFLGGLPKACAQGPNYTLWIRVNCQAFGVGCGGVHQGPIEPHRLDSMVLERLFQQNSSGQIGRVYHHNPEQ